MQHRAEEALNAAGERFFAPLSVSERRWPRDLLRRLIDRGR